MYSKSRVLHVAFLQFNSQCNVFKKFKFNYLLVFFGGKLCIFFWFLVSQEMGYMFIITLHSKIVSSAVFLFFEGQLCKLAGLSFCLNIFYCLPKSHQYKHTCMYIYIADGWNHKFCNLATALPSTLTKRTWFE